MADQALQVYQGEAQSFASGVIEQLDRSLDANLIRHRDGQGGKKLAYIKGSTAIAAANRIFGYGRWGYRVLSQSMQKSFDLDDKPTGIYCSTDLELYVVGAAFPVMGCGAAQVAKPFGPVDYENARKSSVKDALKLALVNYGDQFGLALYDEDSLVEGDDGQLMRVKEVPINDGKSHPQKRVVEASPVNAPTPATLRGLCASVDLKWDVAQKALFQKSIADDAMSPEQCIQMEKALLHRKEMREQVKAKVS